MAPALVLPERQLKLAVLAVEHGLARPEQILEAVTKWLADSSQTIGERLQAMGVLTAENRARLETLASRSQLGEDPTQLTPGSVPRPEVSLASSTAAVTPESPGRYEFKGEHGKGGQAKVYVTLDRHLGREIAWKELSKQATQAPKDSGSASTTSLERFLREARVTGQLEHPNIVPVYELGQRADGAFYYTMRLVRGRTFSAALKGKNLAERLRLLGHFRDVCHALAFAHSRGIIHRDVKPANVMVGEFGETVLLDWGIAKIHGKEDARGKELERRMQQLQHQTSGETLAGDALGTPSYMSPEQAEGRIVDIDERSDVWGLGGLLYEILTGGPPYLGETALGTLSLVSRSPLTPVRRLCPEVPPELAAIAEKALRKRREDRYQTAGKMADDVTAYMTGLRVAAYAYTSWELLRRFAARNKALIAAAASVFVAVVAALIVTGVSLRHESAARSSEQAARAGETVERRNARYHLAQAYAREAERLVDDKNALTARIFAAASLSENPAHPASLDPDPSFVERAPDAAWLRTDALSLLFQTRSHRIEKLVASFALDESVFRIAFSPDGKMLAAGDFSGALVVWSTDGFKELMRVRAQSARVMALAFSPDSKQLVTGGADKILKIWDLASRTTVKTLPPAPDAVVSAAMDPSGTRLATGDMAGRVMLWNLDSGEARSLSPLHAEQVRDLAFTPDGRTLVSGSWDKTARLWDVKSGKVRATLSGHTDAIYGVSVSTDGERLATAGYDRTVRIWDLNSGKALSTVDNRTEAYAVAFSPDGRLFATAGANGDLRLFDSAALLPEAALRAHGSAGAQTLAFHPNGRLLATAGADRVVRIWALSAAGGAPRLEHQDWIYGIAFTPDGHYLATGSWDRKVRVWDARTHELLRTLPGHEAGIMHVTVSADSRLVASASYDSTSRVWDLTTGELKAVLRSDKGIVRMVSFSPDGKLLAMATNDHAVLLWDLAKHSIVASLEGHSAELNGVGFSPDGKLLASAASDRLVLLWDVATGKLLRRLEGHTDWATGIGWSPDGKLLATSGKDTEVILWDPADGKLLARLQGHHAWVDNVTFSPDGKLLASSAEDARVVLWDVASRQPILRLRTSRETQRAAFSPDSRVLAVADFTAVVLYQLELPFTVADPVDLMKTTQAAAGLKLDGFEISIAPPGAR